LLTPIRSAIRARDAFAKPNSAIVSTAAATIWARRTVSVNVLAALAAGTPRPGTAYVGNTSQVSLLASRAASSPGPFLACSACIWAAMSWS
jgi:hypothetical protein